MEFWIGLGFLMGQCALIAWDYSSRVRKTGQPVPVRHPAGRQNGDSRNGLPDRLQMAWLIMDAACSQPEAKGRQATRSIETLLRQLEETLLTEKETEESALQGLYSHRLLLQSCLVLACELQTDGTRCLTRASRNSVNVCRKTMEALSLLVLQLPELDAAQFQRAKGQLLQAAGPSEALYNALLALQDLHARHRRERQQDDLRLPLLAL